MDDNSVVIEQKRKKSFLVIIITIIALVLAGVGVYYGVIRKNIAFKDFKEAVEDRDFKDANKINKKYNLEDSSKKDECEECLEDAKDGIKDKYFKGDISLEECVKQLDEVSKIGFDMDELDADDIYKLLEEYTLKGSEPEARENVEKPDEKTEENQRLQLDIMGRRSKIIDEISMFMFIHDCVCYYFSIHIISC